MSTIPVVNKTLKSLTKLGKDSTNKQEETNIVYKFNCKNCPETYIGESKRALRVRINEHKNTKKTVKPQSMNINWNSTMNLIGKYQDC